VKNLVAKLDTAVTNKDARPGDKLPDLVPALAAKVASLLEPGHAGSIGM
jgi:hypothetical protein